MNTMKCRAAASQLNRSTTTGAKHTHEGLTCTRGGAARGGPRDMKEKAKEKEKYASLVTHEAHISQHTHRSGYAGSQMARLRARL